MYSPRDDGKRYFYFTRMKYFGKCAKEKGPSLKTKGPFLEMGDVLPAQLESELELPRVVGCRGLTCKTSRACGGIAELVDRGHVGAVEKVEAIRDEIELQAFAEGNLLGEAEINLEETWADERVAPQASITTCGRSEKGHHKG